jgi:hypothetical protein
MFWKTWRLLMPGLLSTGAGWRSSREVLQLAWQKRWFRILILVAAYYLVKPVVTWLLGD